MGSAVLVHGGFVDGSGWGSVYQILRKSGHNVTVVQNPTITLADDVAYTRRALDQQDDQAVQMHSAQCPEEQMPKWWRLRPATPFSFHDQKQWRRS